MTKQNSLFRKSKVLREKIEKSKDRWILSLSKTNQQINLNSLNQHNTTMVPVQRCTYLTLWPLGASIGVTRWIWGWLCTGRSLQHWRRLPLSRWLRTHTRDRVSSLVNKGVSSLAKSGDHRLDKAGLGWLAGPVGLAVGLTWVCWWA